MVNRPSTPEIITVNSEELQTQIRDLLPSQNGFGSELQATNVITPIIDLTAAAEGSGLPTNLQNALAFASQTRFDVTNTSSLLVNSPGFYRFVGVSNVTAAGGRRNVFTMSDGLATKDIWEHAMPGAATATNVSSIQFDFIAWLRPGDSISATSSSTTSRIAGSHRQVATGDGTLVQPVGFPL